MEEINYNEKIMSFQKEERPDEELIIKNLSKLLELKHSKKNLYIFPTYNTSYKIYHNKCFNIDSLIYYLSNRDQIGTTDELINCLYEKFQNESLFYIPQLCSFLTYKEYITPIENYILDICVERMKFSLTICAMQELFRRFVAPPVGRRGSKRNCRRLPHQRDSMNILFI